MTRTRTLTLTKTSLDALDLDALVALHRTSFADAHGSILAAPDETTLHVYWKRLSEGDYSCCLAWADDTLVGFLVLTPSRHVRRGDRGEIRALYVAPDHKRCGVGTALVGWAHGQAMERRWRDLDIVVVNGNTSEGFYAAIGGVLDEASEAMIGAERVTLHRYVLPVVDAAGA